MNKMDFISEVLKNYKKNDLNKRQVTELLNSAFKVMGKTILKEKRFSYPKFGSFTLKKGKSITLKHRVIFHKGDEKAAKIAEVFKAYAKEN